MKKLTLSADAEVIRQARRLAAREKTSISAMFGNFIRSLIGGAGREGPVPPDSIAARATGFIARPKGKTPRELLTEALLERYGGRR